MPYTAPSPRETVGRVTTATSARGKQYAAQVLAQEDTEVPASRTSTALNKGCMAGTSLHV